MAIFNSYFDITRGYGGLSAPPWSGFGKSGRGEETSVKQQRTWWSLTIWLVVWNHGILWLSTYKMGMENHPNWRTHSIIFQRGWWLNHQPVMVYGLIRIGGTMPINRTWWIRDSQVFVEPAGGPNCEEIARVESSGTGWALCFLMFFVHWFFVGISTTFNWWFGRWFGPTRIG